MSNEYEVEDDLLYEEERKKRLRIKGPYRKAYLRVREMREKGVRRTDAKKKKDK